MPSLNALNEDLSNGPGKESVVASEVRPGTDPEALAQAEALLKAGELVGFPTETVYGLAADASSGTAVARIFETKGRPATNPLIVHVPGLAVAERHGEFCQIARTLAEHFWPGPITLVLPRKSDSPVSLLVTAGLDTVALRVPAHPVAGALLSRVSFPLAAPSANPSGRVSPTRAGDVLEDFGELVRLILDGGPCEVGLESTVVAVSLPTADSQIEGPSVRILRPGAIGANEIREAVPDCQVVLAQSPDAKAATRVAAGPLLAPGMMVSHYAPEHPLRLGAQTVEADEALLAFGSAFPKGAAVTMNLSKTGDLREAAANLYAYLRALDRHSVRQIAVVPIPDGGSSTGLSAAIQDRLRRAAAPRYGRS